MKVLRWYCPNCDEDKELGVELREQAVRVRGEEMRATGEGLVCPDCQKDIFHPELDGRLQQAALELYRGHHRLLRPEDIRGFRGKYGLSQRALARLLGWGLITIQRYEAGALQDEAHDTVLRQLEEPDFVLSLVERCGARLSEREKKMVGEAVAAAAAGKGKKESGDLWRAAQVWASDRAPTGSPERGFRAFDPERFGQLVLWFAARHGGLFKTKLAKLLWLVDFAHFRRHRISVSGLAYARAPNGPMPDGFLFLLGLLEAQGVVEINEETVGAYQGEVIRSKDFPRADEFSPEERDTLERVDGRFGAMTASRLSELSHRERAWLGRVDGDLIPYPEADGVDFMERMWD